ncbi:flagellar motor protein MotB [Desulfobulbus sp.]|uniref:OmpA/MotB family protein n=1 Tax=Desulfobulbus sp. TaxID=895 RepID=UPI0027B9CBF3|nr:flagellar motor protein MotB [Desulfobulbus sp.]
MAKPPDCPPPGLPMWMATYSDMVTLLLTFFVLLLTMASMDPTKFVQAKSSIEDAFGWSTKAAPVPFSIPVLPSPPKSKFTPIPRQSPIQHFKRIKSDLEMTKLDAQVEAVQRDNDSIILRIHDSVLFEAGKATLDPASYPILRKVADIIRPLPMTMRIEGHTDATPVAGGKTSNWDLSVARAVAVMSFYHRGELFALDRMSATGYGDSRPLVPNTSPENMVQNRRVDFILRSDRPVEQDNKPSTPIPF